jgi:hypothetical protein
VIGRGTIEAARRRNFVRTLEAPFLGYPKTGNTWVRMMLGRYLQQACSLDDLPLFDGYDRLGRADRACIGPSMHFTHDPLLTEEQTAADLDEANVVDPYRGKRIVVIVRYPLDAVVSDWFQATTREDPPYAGALEEFLADDVRGLDKLIRYYGLWAAARERETVTILRYEDLRADTPAAFRALLGFLGIEPDEQLLAEAVEYASFDSMKQMEKAGAGPSYKSSGYDVFATGDRSNPDAYHVRKGQVGGYREYLDPQAAQRWEQRVADEMDPVYGYDTAPGA